jgi:hypothetical protein
LADPVGVGVDVEVLGQVQGDRQVLVLGGVGEGGCGFTDDGGQVGGGGLDGDVAGFQAGQIEQVFGDYGQSAGVAGDRAQVVVLFGDGEQFQVLVEDFGGGGDHR